MLRSRFATPVAAVAAALAAVAVVAAVWVVATALAAESRHGVSPISPVGESTVARGESPTFEVRARGGGQVFVRVCRSPARRSDGLICARESVGRARRGKRGVYRYRPPFRDFPDFWLNRPGVYHWQAHRIRCERRRTKDCRQEGPVLSLTVE